MRVNIEILEMAGIKFRIETYKGKNNKTLIKFYAFYNGSKIYYNFWWIKSKVIERECKKIHRKELNLAEFRGWAERVVADTNHWLAGYFLGFANALTKFEGKVILP